MTSEQPSERAELARLSLGVALGHPDVLEGMAATGGALVTVVEDERLEGVTVAAAVGGDYAVTLRLRTEIVPMLELAEELRRRIVAAAEASTAAGHPKSIEIQIADVGGAS